MMQEEFSTVNGALNILLSHITKVLSASSDKNMIAVTKEYDVKRHFATMHSTQYDEILGQAQMYKILHFFKSIKNSSLFQLQERNRTVHKTEL